MVMREVVWIGALFLAVFSGSAEARPRLGRPLTRPESAVLDLPMDRSLLAYEERQFGTELEIGTGIGLNPQTQTFGLMVGAALSLKWALETELRVELEASGLGRGESIYGFKPALAVKPPILQATFFEWALVPSLSIAQQTSALLALEARVGLARLESSRIEFAASIGPTFAEPGVGLEAEIIAGAIWAFREGREMAFGVGMGARQDTFDSDLEGFGRFELNYYIDPLSFGLRFDESIGGIAGPTSIGMTMTWHQSL